MTQPTLFDRDLSRGRHHANSQAAHARVAPHKSTLRQQCLDYIASKPQGATLADLCAHLGKPMHSLSGRVTELKARNQIKEAGRRDGFSLLVVFNSSMKGACSAVPEQGAGVREDVGPSEIQIEVKQ